MTNDEIEAKIARTAGQEQDAAIKYLADCGNALAALRNQLK